MSGATNTKQILGECSRKSLKSSFLLHFVVFPHASYIKIMHFVWTQHVERISETICRWIITSNLYSGEDKHCYIMYQRENYRPCINLSWTKFIFVHNTVTHNSKYITHRNFESFNEYYEKLKSESPSGGKKPPV